MTDNAIRREDKKHIDGFKYWCETNEENGTITIPKFVCDEIVKILDKFSSVTPSRRKGHWIRWREDFEYIERGVTESVPHCQCSECKKEYDPHTAQFINFCPNCGAKMSE